MSALLMMMLASCLGSFAMSPSARRLINGGWVVAIAGILGATFVMTVHKNGTVDLSNPGNGTASVNIPSSGRIVTPGSTAFGSWSATSTPGAQGNSGDFGYSDVAVGTFDLPPYQIVSGNINVGVVASHNAGIAKVSFIVDNGTPLDITGVSANAQTLNAWSVGVSTDVSGYTVYSGGILDYWATLRASDCTDGPHEVRAIIYPVTGVPRVLSGMVVVTNGGGTITRYVKYVSATGSDSTGDGTRANPYATINKGAAAIKAANGNKLDQGIVYLRGTGHQYPGSVSYSCVNGWFTIAGDPQDPPLSASITSFDTNYGYVVPLLRLQGLTIACNVPSGTSGCRVWMEGCDSSGTVAVQTTGDWAHVYITECDLHNMQNATSGADLIRNTYAYDCLEDAFRPSGGDSLLVNCHAHNLNVTNDPNSHADVVQYGDVTDNCTVYGLKASGTINAQGISNGLTSVSNMAFVGIDFNAITIQNLMAERPWTNALFDKVKGGGTWVWNTADPTKNFSATDVVVQNSSGATFNPNPQTGVRYR